MSSRPAKMMRYRGHTVVTKFLWCPSSKKASIEREGFRACSIWIMFASVRRRAQLAYAAGQCQPFAAPGFAHSAALKHSHHSTLRATPTTPSVARLAFASRRSPNVDGRWIEVCCILNRANRPRRKTARFPQGRLCAECGAPPDVRQRSGFRSVA